MKKLVILLCNQGDTPPGLFNNFKLFFNKYIILPV